MPPLGFKAQIGAQKRTSGLTYINADGAQTMFVPVWMAVTVLVLFLGACGLPFLITAIDRYTLSVQVSESETRQQKTLADIQAYQSTTYAQCKAAEAVGEKVLKEELKK